jgi:hypothetical protein
MIEGSRCKRRPSSLTLTLPHSRPKYTDIDLAAVHFRCRPAWTMSFSDDSQKDHRLRGTYIMLKQEKALVYDETHSFEKRDREYDVKIPCTTSNQKHTSVGESFIHRPMTFKRIDQ